MIKQRSRAASERQRRAEIIYYLRNRQIPIKYEYLGRGAKRFDRLSRSPGYISQSETSLLERQSGTLLKPVRAWLAHNECTVVNVIDIGCGNGQKAAEILKHLIEHFPNLEIRYEALDISTHMRRIAKETVSHQLRGRGKKLRVTSKAIDFEEESLLNKIWSFRQEAGTMSLFLFLGNTLGNVPRKIQEQVLSNVARAMRDHDRLLLGVEVEVDRITKPLLAMYSDPLVIDFLSTALGTLGITPAKDGLPGDGKICPEVGAEGGVQITFKFTKNAPPIRDNGRELRFSPGDRVTLAISERFSRAHLAELLLRCQLEETQKAQSDSGSLVLLCKTV